MSVINKMLRDLDKQQPPQHRGFVGFKPQRKSHWLAWAAVPMALLAGWCGQAWYMERFSVETAQVVTESEVQQGQLHPLSTAVKLIQQTQNPTAASPDTAAAEQVISLQDVVATRVSPELAAQLGKTAPKSAEVTAEPKLQPFVSQPVAEQRVVQVQLSDSTPNADSSSEQLIAVPQPQDETLGDSAEPEFVAATSSDVEVSEFDQAGEFAAQQDTELQADWNDTVPEVSKPRSLAIEKVQLSADQQKQLLQQKAQKAESSGNLNQATAHWQQLRQLQPETSQPYLELARLAQLQRNDSAAVQILEQATASGVQDPNVSMALAALALKQQDWSKALSYLQYEPDIFNYTDFYALKAAALQKTNQHAQSVQVFQQLARQQPEQARWWLGMALSYDAMQQPEQALLAYRQVAVNGVGLSAASLDYVKKRIAALE